MVGRVGGEGRYPTRGDEWAGGWFWRQKSEPRRVVLPGYRRTTVTPSPNHRSPVVPRSPPALWRHPRLLLHHLLHLLDDAIPSFIISCTSDFENSNNFLLPPGWRAKRGGERGGRGWPGLRGLVLPAAWRWFQVADAGAVLFVWHVIPAGRIETAKVDESPEAPRDYLGKRICRSPPGPISPKRASSKRTSSTDGPRSIDARPRAGAPSGSSYPDILRRTRRRYLPSVFLGL
ncbi:hypothetical protein ALC57_13488 [Trachymyrmex cornetzi]|uniref:Uncharacterized protein n=1 Tax=Trachymyrmex cornetzi TaxID=471704 RepID=A0A195DNB6_9HYME|nr:hypothetical protein ALC57_13488 [Trachymyrmex cornetzi]